MNSPRVKIIGAGLAGSEAAWQIANSGVLVQLFEMRPSKMTKAHKTGDCAELVCSNSFRGAALNNAVGLLKEELRLFNSLVMQAADACSVPAGGALAVDRERFSSFVTSKLKAHPLIEFVEGEVSELPVATPEQAVIIATGPLTSPALAEEIKRFTDEDSLSFFDAISPIVLFESLDMSKLWRQSRYDKGGADYINVGLREEAYYKFVSDVAAAEKYGGKEEVEADEIENVRPFEGCMPIEEMIARGPETLRFGPFKPVGLTNPHTSERPYAVMQLRQDDREGVLWSLVGMQTRMRHGEQLRIFRSLPGLEQAEFVRLGTVHRNTFINSPKVLLSTLQTRSNPYLFFAGQVTGTEGYVESTAGGLVAGLNASRLVLGETPITVPRETAIGGLLGYISDDSRKDFQPMNISFGLIQDYGLSAGADGVLSKKNKLSKKDRRLATANRALSVLRSLVAEARVGGCRPAPAQPRT